MKYEIDLAIVGIQGLPCEYGGFETLCDNLCKNFYKKYKLLAFCSSSSNSSLYLSDYKYAKRFFIPLKSNGMQSILYDYIAIIIGCLFSKRILILGVSGISLLPLIKLFSRSTIIYTHIDGIEENRSKWNNWAKFFLKFSKLMALKFSDYIILDNKEIYNILNHSYGKKFNSKFSYHLYGGDHLEIKEKDFEINHSNKVLKELINESNYFLGLSRIEPENNIEIILKTFSQIKTKKLIYVGNWEITKFSKELYRKYSNFKNIQLLHPIYDKKLVYFLRKNSIAYIHGHEVGGTNPSLVEAINCQQLCIAFNAKFNRFTLKNNGLFWFNEKELKLILNSQDLEKNKLLFNINLKDSRLKDYTWKYVSKKYEDLIFHNQKNSFE